MKPRPIIQDQNLLFKSRLSEQLNPKHELLRFATAINWNQLEIEFSPLFSAGAGHPPIPIRLACGLMILQHMFDLSDEKVVEAWVENPYWQAFCGYDFSPVGITHSPDIVDTLETTHRRTWRGKNPADVSCRSTTN